MLDLVTDPYERKARVTPGLLVALPCLVPLVCVYGPKNPTLTAMVTLMGGCGVIYALASIARGRGKKLEERLLHKWGGLPTTLLLRHRDTFLDRVTKKRYHAAIAAKLGIQIPNKDEELANPAKADDAYIASARRLRELTRGNKSLLLKENIAYGFHRNMRAMRVLGLSTSAAGLLYGGILAGVLVFEPLQFSPEELLHPGLAAGLTLAVSLALFLMWCFFFDEAAVKRMGCVYAERLFEQLETLPSIGSAPKRAPRAKKPASVPAGK